MATLDEFSYKADFGLKENLKPLLNRALRFCDQASNVRGGRGAKIHHDIGVNV